MAAPKMPTDNAPDVMSKLPPQAMEAEQSVLGGLLLDSRKWDDVSEVVNHDDFYHQKHREIFSAISALREHDEAIDVVTTSEWLDRQGLLESIGGLQYLGALANNTPSTSNIKAYANIVHERSVLRRLITATNDIAQKSYSPNGAEVKEIIDFAEKLVFDISILSCRSMKLKRD